MGEANDVFSCTVCCVHVFAASKPVALMHTGWGGDLPVQEGGQPSCCPSVIEGTVGLCGSFSSCAAACDCCIRLVLQPQRLS